MSEKWGFGAILGKKMGILGVKMSIWGQKRRFFVIKNGDFG